MLEIVLGSSGRAKVQPCYPTLSPVGIVFKTDNSGSAQAIARIRGSRQEVLGLVMDWLSKFSPIELAADVNFVAYMKIAQEAIDDAREAAKRESK